MLTKIICGSLYKKARKIVGPVIKISTEMKKQDKLWNINKLICGDNLVELAKIKEEIVDLIYIDPPFFSNKNYEVIWKDEAETRSFKDRWAGGIEHYMGWMEERVIELHRVLKPTGSMYLHCDWHASHYLKVMMDKVFGKENFQNEIIWRYRRWPTKAYRFQRMHDVILFYSKTASKKRPFKTLYEKLAESTRKQWGTKKQKAVFREGRRAVSSIAEEESLGVPMSDVWNISVIAPRSKERLGYPTQKPEALLERIIKASSNKGDLVLDAFAGCGTALAVAQKLGRKWIGIDISPTAIKLMEKRLKKRGAGDIVATGLPQNLDDLKELDPFEFQNWVINEMGAYHSKKKTGDMGVDGYFAGDLFREPAIIQVKQSEGVGRNVVDNFETAMRREKKQVGYIVAFSFGKGAYEETARVKNREKLIIKLITVRELQRKGSSLISPRKALKKK